MKFLVVKWIVWRSYHEKEVYDCQGAEMLAHRAVLPFVIAISLLDASYEATSTTPAPNIELRTDRGVTARLGDFKGEVVLVDLWASWCVPCAKSFPAIDSLYRRFRGRGFQVLAINVDGRRPDADRFLRSRPHVMSVFFDPEAESVRAFGVAGIPTALLIDRNGNVRFTHAGYSERIAEACRSEIETLLQER